MGRENRGRTGTFRSHGEGRETHRAVLGVGPGDPGGEGRQGLVSLGNRNDTDGFPQPCRAVTKGGLPQVTQKLREFRPRQPPVIHAPAEQERQGQSRTAEGVADGRLPGFGCEPEDVEGGIVPHRYVC
ncbi:hypothetical protein RQ832_21675, partial [Roseomonas sp. DSM 102946]|nr:hypothetical protein [Roseomonas sp. DSM 102946]